MRILPSLPDNFLDTPYGDDSDALSKSDLAKRLTNLYANLDHGTVAILHGRWGTGKSTFSRKWVVELADEGFGTVYFDAFANDYLSDPFLALSSALMKRLEGTVGAKPAKAKAFKLRAAAASKKLLIAGAKIGIKASTLGALSLSDLDISESHSSGISDDTSVAFENVIATFFDEQVKAEKVFEEFRENLAEIVNLMSKTETRGQGKLIFVIDELDRCRPDFALGIIETIKHFFDVQGLHFVLVANKEFLIQSVSAKYGLVSGGEEYLDKFFNFAIFFEEGAPSQNSSSQINYARQIVSDLLGGRAQESQDIEDAIAEISGAFGLTLRQIERIATNAVLAYSSAGENEYRPSYLVAYLCFIKAIYPSLFARVKRKQFQFEDFQKILDAGDWGEHSSIERIKEIFEYHSKKVIDDDDARMTKYEGSYARYSFRSRLDVLPYLANSVIDRFSRI